MAKENLRTAKLSVNPADVTIDARGHVVIKDLALAEAIKAYQAHKEPVADMGDICCHGCGC